MIKYNVAQSLSVVCSIKQMLEELGLSNEVVTIGYTDYRAKELIGALPNNYASTTDLDSADVFLSLDNTYNTANDYDLPLVAYDLSTILLAWDDAQCYRDKTHVDNIAPSINTILNFVTPDGDREGLAETPARVAKAWAKWTSGYDKDPASILKVFEDGAENCDEMVIVKDIPIYSHCEHHLAAIFGTATIAYIPNGKIVGLSKLSRLADMFARRLQVQERLTNQIADAIEEHLGALGVAVVIRARHMCMESRGVCQQGHHTITSALRGTLKDNQEARAEFMALANSPITV